MNDDTVTSLDTGPEGLFVAITQFLEAGGTVLYIIAALSVLALAIVLMKLTHFAMQRLWSTGFVATVRMAWRADDGARALSVLVSSRNPVAAILESVARETIAGGPRNAAREERVSRRCASLLADLSSHLRTLALIATLSPLLGLLGTVIGMIDAFQALEAAGSRVDPSVLSGGIWQALLTTAAGLSVAIPATAAHHWLEGIVDRVARITEEAVNELLDPPGTAHAPGSTDLVLPARAAAATA